MKRSRHWLAAAVVLLGGLSLFLAARSGSRQTSPRPDDLLQADLRNLQLLKPNQLLAKVGEVELRSQDLREALQRDFHGQVSHAGLSAEDLASRIGRALDQLIEDELLAQEARRQGFKSSLAGPASRQDLARQSLQQYLAKLPAVTDADLRSFYKNHGEKFYIPPSARVRELFLPLQGTGDKKEQTIDKSYLLGQELAARIRQGESLEALARQNVPEAHRSRAQVHQFMGSVMSPKDEGEVLALRPGEVIGPVRVEGGFSVFQGVAQIRSSRMTFYEAKEKIRAYLDSRRLEEARKRFAADLRQQISVERFYPDKAVASAR